MSPLNALIHAGRTFVNVLSAPVEEIVVASIHDPESLTASLDCQVQMDQVEFQRTEQLAVGITTDGWMDLDAQQPDHAQDESGEVEPGR